MKSKAYLYRFYPNPEQVEILAKSFGCKRVVYNKALALKKAAYEKDKTSLNNNQLNKLLTAWRADNDLLWLSESSRVPQAQALRDLDGAYSKFFSGQNGYPKFKKKSHEQSIRLTKAAFSFKEGEIYMASSKEPLSIIWSREFNTEPSSITITKKCSGKYFVSILVEENVKPLKRLKTSVGVDVGISTLVTLSTGEKIQGPKSTKKFEVKLAKLQRRLSKKQKGSSNRSKARIKVAKLQEKIADVRKDFNHKLSTRLIRENQTIVIEDLAIRNMVKNKKLSKHISDSAWGQFFEFLKYKADWYGREVVEVNQWFPSSKMCSNCYQVVDKLPLSIRSWKCKECGVEHDRDVNAALNILAAGQVA